jgi:hypothetical protein
MAAPDYVPVLPQDRPRRPEQLPPARRWRATRPGDFVHTRAGQPRGPRLGTPGPDLGYAAHLARQFEGHLHLQPGEDPADVEAGCVALAMKRAALFGRAPVIHDLRRAYELWGFLDPTPPPELVERRRALFRGAAHDYWVQRAVVDAVADEELRRPG